MSSTHPYAVTGALVRIWTDGRRVERIAYVVGAVLFASGLGHGLFLLLTGGSWEGPLSLRKPTAFGLSFGLTLASVSWVTSLVAIRETVRRTLLGVFMVTCVGDVLLVSIQAWRGVPSHFNFETPFDNAVAMMLAAGGALIIVTMVGFAVATIVGTGPLTPTMRAAVRFGFVSLLAALISGAIMIGTGVAQARGGDPQLAYATGGWLKPLHAVTMHGILVLPGLAWLLRFAGWSEQRRLRLVGTAIVAYAILIVVVAIESFTGVSPLAAGPVETLVSAVALAVLIVSGGIAARGVVLPRRNGLLRTDYGDSAGWGLTTTRTGVSVNTDDQS